MRTSEVDERLRERLSDERLSRYLKETNDELAAALDLYERNTRLAEALYTPFQCMEVCLRNTLHNLLAERYGADWPATGVLQLNPVSERMLNEAIREHRDPQPGDIVASLKFAFWVSLVGKPYDATLWRQGLHKGFREGGGRKRSVVHGRFNALRRFRNRIAHHEPIYFRAMQMHGEVIEAIGWMCADTQQWAQHQSRFHDVYNA